MPTLLLKINKRGKLHFSLLLIAQGLGGVAHKNGVARKKGVELFAPHLFFICYKYLLHISIHAACLINKFLHCRKLITLY